MSRVLVASGLGLDCKSNNDMGVRCQLRKGHAGEHFAEILHVVTWDGA